MSKIIATAKNVTEEMLSSLRREAIEADDDDMACMAIISEYGTFDADEWAACEPSSEARNMGRDEALAACVRAINAARANEVTS